MRLNAVKYHLWLQRLDDIVGLARCRVAAAAREEAGEEAEAEGHQEQ